MLKTWLFDFIHLQGRTVSAEAYEDPKLVQQTFEDAFLRLSAAERSGFEGVFLSEHHFLNSLSSTPNLILAALARETKTLRLGVMGNVLPFHQPWRLAEELATLDYITNGRLEIGISSGVPMEFGFVNIAQRDARPMYEEAVEILEIAGKQRRVTYKGQFFDLDDVPLMPRLRPEPRRRRWATLYSESTARRSAARGHRICCAYVACETFRPVVEAYHDEARKHGIVTTADDVGIRRQVLICDSDSQAAELNAEFLPLARARFELRHGGAIERMRRSKDVGDVPIQSGAMDAGAASREAMVKGSNNPLAALISVEDEYIFGSPKTVADRIIDQCRRCGAGNMMAHHSTAHTREEVADMYARLWPEVLKITSKAGVEPEMA